MNNDIKFKNLNDLYNRILPALRSKTKEIKKEGLKYIHEEDIWNFLKKYKWTSSRDLDLGSMVNDIFDVNILELDNFVRDEIKHYRRKIDKEEI
ncbi:MAG: hypothetical protein HFI36_01905 [Bacilli bacterium]|jgi:hypothetical protein|nr:hypothetical protein [Bacilli bacterium]